MDFLAAIGPPLAIALAFAAAAVSAVSAWLADRRVRSIDPRQLETEERRRLQNVIAELEAMHARSASVAAEVAKEAEAAAHDRYEAQKQWSKVRAAERKAERDQAQQQQQQPAAQSGLTPEMLRELMS